MTQLLTPEIAGRFARLALGHVQREFPNKLDHVLTGTEDVRGPRDLHPIFYGSFDWHSCVHGYWLLARLLRLHPALPEKDQIRELFARQLTPAKATAELAYLQRPASRGFERTYGWVWLLKLQAELTQGADSASARALKPLAVAFADRLKAYLPLATYPIRAGTHANSAFALTLAHDYAVLARDAELEALLLAKALAWFEADRACQAWEPSGDDFLSSALMEAECLRRLLPKARFAAWLDAFLPDLARGQPASLLRPAEVSDRSDGKIAHLDGLNLSRAWCWRGLAHALPPGDPRADLAGAAADRHLAASLPHVAGDYMGEHWLATFAALALSAD